MWWRKQKNDSILRFTTLRQRLFRRFGLLLVVAIVCIALSYTYFGIKPAVNLLAENHFVATAESIETSMRLLFLPEKHLIDVAADWLAAPEIKLTEEEKLNFLFKPLLKRHPQVTSVVVGSTDGQGYMLLEKSDDCWFNRITNIPENGTLQRFVEWHGDERTNEYRQPLDYDPRQRPWFKNAIETKHSADVNWTKPYIFFTTKDPGITVSRRINKSPGNCVVVGFDIMLRDVSLVTANCKIAQNGFVTVLTGDERVLGVPGGKSIPSTVAVNQCLLQPVAHLKSPVINGGLDAWHKGNMVEDKIYHYTVAGEPWLSTFVRFELGQQHLWICMFAPVGDFVPAWRNLAQALGVILLLVMLGTLLVTRRMAYSLSRPLELLVSASEDIAKLDFSHRDQPFSAIAEINRLVTAQDKMRSMLAEFQTTVTAQQADLHAKIASLRKTESSLRDSEENLHRALRQAQVLFDNVQVGIVYLRNQKIIDCNRQLCEMTGYIRGEVIGGTQEKFYLSSQAYLATLGQIESAFARGRDFITERLFHNKDNTSFWAQTSGRLLDKENPSEGSVWMVVDLSKQKQAQQRLEYLSYHDPLTTLPNRLLLHDRLVHAIGRAQRTGGQLAVVFIDLDHFKAINDTLGHDVGDQVLVDVAKLLANSLRTTDTLARFGGDEFVVLIEDVVERKVISELAEKLLRKLSEPITIDERSFYLTMSIGISLYPEDGSDLATLVRNADAAMYQSKVQGRNSYNFYAASMSVQAFERMHLEGELRRAIENNQLEFYLQPQIKLPEKELIGMEALLRWNHPQKGQVSPATFIPLAEDTGIILDLGDWILEQCCLEWVRLNRQGLKLPRIAVNFSVKQLLRSNAEQAIMEILQRSQCPADAIEVEITESIFLEESVAVGVLLKLAENGLHLSLDDFGTGYSSLSYLKRLPFDKLKIDRSFVLDIGVNADGETIIHTIINLARTLGMAVIAEGVETAEQSDFLLDAGCTQIQGYLYGRPMPLPQFYQWLEENSVK
ncbi:MAG: hypothetical protein B6I36_04000 [Desulfobacteraceae bacterium 4572_35.1]|nr:MAG: hypothetical protein B6I36_04000 [Desulfobacteraceae bacterium 4572_35.1]